MHLSLIAIELQWLGTRGALQRQTSACETAINKELCGQVFMSGWGLFVGTIVVLIVFYRLTEHVPCMRGWWKHLEWPATILTILSTVIGFVLISNAKSLSGG